MLRAARLPEAAQIVPVDPYKTFGEAARIQVGVVDVIDLLAVIDGWGTESSDMNGDGTTDVLDLLAVIDGWGTCP